MRTRRFAFSPHHAALIVVLIGFAALAWAYSQTPIFEAPDEIEHYRYARTLRDTGALPDPTGQVRGQYHQAPLYYLLLAPVLALLPPDSDFEQIDGRLNPFYGRWFTVPGNDNKHLYLHTRAEAWPYGSATALAVHTLRGVSILLGLVTVCAVYRIGRRLWPETPGRALLAAGITAFYPLFLYINGVLNNDSLLTCLAALLLWALIVQHQDGISAARSIGIGVLCGAVLLTKVSGVALMGVVGLAFLIHPAATQRRLHYGVLAGVVAAGLAGGWYVRNLLLTGDLTGVAAMLVTWPDERIGGVALDVGIPRLAWTYQTAWARFGHGAVPVAAALYRLFDALIALAGIGLAIALVRALRQRAVHWHEVTLIGAFGAVWVVNTVYLASVAWSGNQGRYLLPGIAALALAGALAFDALCPRRARPVMRFIGVAAWAALAALILGRYLLPAYQPYPLPGVIEKPMDIRYQGDIALIGTSTDVLRAAPGETVEVWLYWRASAPGTDELRNFVHSLENAAVRIDSYPAGGNRLAGDWQPGETWAERWRIAVPPDAPPGTLTLIAGWYDAATGQTLGVVDATGAPSDALPIIARLEVVG
ncbi:MAG: glycosyltransferase family 39 protein [bacterium]|nr:glycosyltransferase family 39 protein [bacterium]